MDRLEAYERRAWRLATLLTGDESAAADVVRRCLDAQSRPDRLPPERLDRLVIQAARRSESRPAPTPLAERGKQRLASIRRQHLASRGVVSPDTAPQVASSFSPEAMKAVRILRTLPQQQREAWILQELDAAESIPASKAMDCSRTALQRHLDLARRTMAQALGDEHDSAIAALKRDADALDPSPFVSRRAEKRRRLKVVRRTVIVGAVAVIGIALIVVVFKVVGGAP